MFSGSDNLFKESVSPLRTSEEDSLHVEIVRVLCCMSSKAIVKLIRRVFNGSMGSCTTCSYRMAFCLLARRYLVGLVTIDTSCNWDILILYALIFRQAVVVFFFLLGISSFVYLLGILYFVVLFISTINEWSKLSIV